MKRFFLALFLLLPLTIFAQIKGLEGRVTDARGQGIAYANVVLMALPDSLFLQGVITDEQGTFRFDTMISRPQASSVLLRVSAVGFTTALLRVEDFQGKVELKEDVQLLQEITVKGNLPHTQIKDDALVTIIEGTVLEKTGTLEQLLQKIPNVSMGHEGVNVFGRGVADIYLNSRKLRDMAELEQLSSGQVHSVEVITNPGARYGASVPAVIRIRTRKAAGEGFSFTDRSYLRYNMKKFSALNQYDANYRKNGLDLSAMLDMHRNNTREESNDPIYLYVNNHIWKQDQYTMGNNPSEGYAARVSLNYTFSPKHAVGIRYDVMRRDKRPWLGYMETTMYLDDAYYDYSYDDDHIVLPETRHGINAYYEGVLGRFTIDWNSDVFYRKRDRNQEINEFYYDATGYSEEVLIQSLNHTTNHLAASKLVASTPWGDGEFSIGTEFTYTDQNNDFRNPQQIMQSSFTELYERELSFFAEYSLKIGKAQLQAGVRYENINTDYYQNGVRNEQSSRRYKNIFPTFSFTAPLANAQWSVRYSQGIKRPSYNQMRGSVSYLCRYAYETGNPMLRPTFSKEASASLTYQFVQLELGFTHFSDPVFYTSKLLREDDIITYVYDENADSYNRVTAALNLSPQLGFWLPRWGLALQKQWIEMDTPLGHKKLNTPYCSFTWQNTLKLGNDWLFSCDMQLDTRGYIRNAYQYKENFNMRASLSKSFLQDALILQLEGTNVLGTYQADPSRQFCGELILLDLGRTKMSTITFTARYRFNATGSKYRGTGAGQSQRSRM